MKGIKSIIGLLAALLSITTADAQNADPAINILMDPAIVQVNRTGVVRVDATNTAGDPIVQNSLEITVSMSNNAEITGLATGSSSVWTISSIGSGAANTVKLRNTAGGLAAYSTDNILLDVTARTVGPLSNISGNIVYVTGTNPFTGAPYTGQGNTQTGNDNSTTSLTVSAGNPLPIELSAFTGAMQNCEATISWTVAATKPYAAFTLEQSGDGQSYSPVAAVKPETGRQRYTYSLHQDASRSFYRLKLSDLNGMVSYSNTLSLTADCRLGGAGLSPNPTRSGIRISGLAEGGSVRVYNHFGALVIQKSNASDQVDLSALPAGLYKVSWDTQEGVVTRSVTKL